MNSGVIPTLDYAGRPSNRGASKAILIGIFAAVIADIALIVAIFIWNGGRIWGRYLNPLVAFYRWGHPIFIASLVLGVVACFATGIGLVRPARAALKVSAAIASGAYLVGFGCVVIFGLI